MPLSMLIAPLVLAGNHLPPLANDVSRRAVQYFWDHSNPNTGLALDRYSNVEPDPAHPIAPDKYLAASQAATGYALCAYSVGVERGWLKKKDALERTRMTLHFLNEKGARDHGWFYHFIDWRDGKRMWNSEVSSIDSALLFAGVLMAQSEFRDQEIDVETKKLFEAVDWGWMLTDGGAKPNEKTFCMGYTPEKGFINARWNHYYENPFFNVIALGVTPKVPDETWPAFKRDELSYKEYKFLNGGPLFIHEMGHDFLDMRGKRDSLGYDYWVSSRNEVLATRQWCIDNPGKFKGYGPSTWGLNACDIPDGYSACAGFGTGLDNGTLMPSSALGALMFTPKLSLEAAEAFKSEYPKAYGRYGFANAINPTKDWIDPDVIGIDLGMVMLGIENYRDGLPHRLMERNPVIRVGMKRAGFKKTEEGPLEDRPMRIG